MYLDFTQWVVDVAPKFDVDIQGFFVVCKVDELPIAMECPIVMDLSELFLDVQIMVAAWNRIGGVIKSSKKVPK